MMYQFNLKGSYYDIGVTQGQKIKEGIYGDYKFLSTKPSEKRAEFTDECEKIVKKYIPSYLDEIQGVADASDIDYETIRVWPLSLYSESVPSCSIIAISSQYTQNGKPIFIRNYDYLTRFEPLFTVFWTTPEGKIANIGFCDLFGSRYGGVNEKGLCVAISSSPYYGKPKPGIVMNLATRWVLDNYNTTKQAVDFLKQVPHFHGFNFLICDKEDNISRVETCPEYVADISYPEGFAVSTNHYFDNKMKEFQRPVKIHYDSSLRRYNNALSWFKENKGNISTENAIELTSKHGNGLCDHFKDGKQDGSTIWSWIYQYSGSELLLAHGPPCANSYQNMSLKNLD